MKENTEKKLNHFLTLFIVLGWITAAMMVLAFIAGFVGA